MIAQPRIDDGMVEALLAGRAVNAELQPLVEVVRACREMADRPVPPSPALAAQMTTGVFTAAAASVPRTTPSRGRRLRRPGRSRARIAAFALAGGAGALVVTASGAGFAGVLPDRAQQRFAEVVESVTPLEVPGGRVAVDPGYRHPHDRDEFGDQVSDDANDGGVDGGDVSERAREQGDQPPRPSLAPPRPSQAPAQPAGPVDDAGPSGRVGPPAAPDPPAPQRPTGPPAPPGADNRPSAPPGR